MTLYKTYVPSSSSTIPASHPSAIASSSSPLTNNVYLNDDISHANADLVIVWFVCDRIVDDITLLDNDDVDCAEFNIDCCLDVLDIDGDNLNGE